MSTKKSVKWLWMLVTAVIVAVIGAWCGYSAASSNGGIESTFKVSAVTALLAGIFVISALGYLLGRISVGGVSLGTAGVFLVAILFGYLCTIGGLENIPILNSFFIKDSASTLNTWYSKVVQNVGLVLFVAAVGFIAGPNFFKNLKKNAKSYLILSLVITTTGALIAIIFAFIPGISPEFSVGVLSGALTTTPGFSAALEATENVGRSTDIVTFGHAIAYPFGVIGIVLFVQLMPKILKADMDHERELLRADAAEAREEKHGLFSCDQFGLTPFALAIVLGLILGSINVPLTVKGYAGPCFSLGTTGGVLIMTLVFGHFGNLGKLSLAVPESTAKTFRELGLVLFLIGAGVSGGVSLVSEINNSDFGAMIVVYGLVAGVIMKIVPMIVGFVFARYVLKLSLLNNLGAISGGMTSTPALGTLINTAKTDDVASAYASTYPIALVLIVLVSQLIITLMA